MPIDRRSTAHTFFDWIKGSADPLATVHSLIRSTPPTFEADHLDFKGSIDQGKGTPLQDEKIKEIWSEALGGFANAGGGVLLWGIDARPVNGVDAADKEILVPDVYAFQSKLKDWQRSANDPPVGGVEFLTVPAAGGKDGFLVCLIPQSDIPPHNCEYVKNKPYRMRIGDNFVNIAPPLLRKMFYPQSSPALRFTAASSVSLEYSGHYVATVSISLSVANIGTATARDVYVVASLFPPKDGNFGSESGRSNNKEWDITATPGNGYGFFAKHPLHPKQTSTIYNFSWKMSQNIKLVGNKAIGVYFEPFVLRINAYADNMEAQFYSVTITEDHVNNVTQQNCVADQER